MATLPSNWKNWVLQNLLKGVSAGKLHKTLLENGFTHESCVTALGKNIPADCPVGQDRSFYESLCHPALFEHLERFDGKVVDTPGAQLVVLDNFMSVQECDDLIELAKSKLRPSEISASSGYEGFRTSSTCDLTFLNSAFSDEIEARIVNTMGLGVGENEVIQAQHYSVGQQFKAHTDYFEPGAQEYKDFARKGGQRTWTFMVYLNEACEGGQTEFPLLKQSFQPKTGRALIWNNLTNDGSVNSLTLHRAHPVTSGEKVVITKWFRERAM